MYVYRYIYTYRNGKRRRKEKVKERKWRAALADHGTRSAQRLVDSLCASLPFFLPAEKRSIVSSGRGT